MRSKLELHIRYKEYFCSCVHRYGTLPSNRFAIGVIRVIQKLHDLQPRLFADALGSVVSHSRPIESAQHLKGREANLKTVTQAIYAAGRHVFIYGERGVGKTSLAKTAGMSAATNSRYFKQIGCASDTTFDELLRMVVSVFLPERLTDVQKKSSWGLSWLGV